MLLRRRIVFLKYFFGHGGGIQNNYSKLGHIMRGRERETFAGSGGITGLNEERIDDAVEDGVVVVTLQAELDEVPDGLGGLLGP